MAMKECRECGKKISTEAKSCPHCGVPLSARSLSSLTGCGALIVMVFLALMWTGSTSSPSPTTIQPKGREDLARESVSYLLNKNAYPTIAWVDVNSNTINIGFTKKSREISAIIREAALRCNKAIDFGCHVWAIPANSTRPWRGGDGEYYENVTARYGGIQ